MVLRTTIKNSQRPPFLAKIHGCNACVPSMSNGGDWTVRQLKPTILGPSEVGWLACVANQRPEEGDRGQDVVLQRERETRRMEEIEGKREKEKKAMWCGLMGGEERECVKGNGDF